MTDQDIETFFAILDNGTMTAAADALFTGAALLIVYVRQMRRTARSV